MDKKEQILDLYFNKHLKQAKIAKIVDASQQYISKIIKKDERYENEKSSRKSKNAKNEKLLKLNIRRIMLEKKKKISLTSNYYSNKDKIQ